MSKWRIALLLLLFFLPMLFLMGFGAYALWLEGWWYYVWWPLALSVLFAYGLAWHWHRKQKLLPKVEFDPPMEWTAQDHEALRLVEARAALAKDIPPDQFMHAAFYLETAQSLADELARFYHPTSSDPLSALTIPEILAVVELAAKDLGEVVEEYIPGGHFLRIRDWRRAREITKWYNRASNFSWGVSAILSPVKTAARYGAWRYGLKRPFEILQNNLLSWFYSAFVQRVGTYLIELNSGRLKVGAVRHREMTRLATEPADSVEGMPPAPAVKPKGKFRRVLSQVGKASKQLLRAARGPQAAKPRERAGPPVSHSEVSDEEKSEPG